MYKAIVTVDGKHTVKLESDSPAGLGVLVGELIAEDVLDGNVEVVYEVTGPISRRLTPRVVPLAPTMLENVITIPTVEGIKYQIDSEIVTGPVTLSEEDPEVTIVAHAQIGFVIPDGTTKTWTFNYTE